MPLKLNSTGGGSVTLDTPSTAGTYTVTVPATNQTLGITSGTAVASTSGTSIDFTGIPSWVKRITVMFSGTSLSGTSHILVQLGYSGGIENSGYLGSTSALDTGIILVTSTAGIPVYLGGAARSVNGNLFICNVSGNAWSANGSFYNTVQTVVSGGAKTISGGTLDRVRITTVNGTDTFDAGTINIMYEG